jgi:hypothetical protein
MFSFYRPSIKELLAKDFFAEDTGFKVELAQREELVKSDKNDVNFRLRSVGQMALDTSVADPDPRVFGPPGSGSGSISQRYGSGSGSFYH